MMAREIPVFSHLLSHKYDLRVLPRLRRLLVRRQTEAVVTVGAGDRMFWGRLAARLAGVPVVLTALHSTGWPDVVGRLNRLLTPITDGFIAVAEEHGRYLREVERFPPHKVFVIPNGVDTERTFGRSRRTKPCAEGSTCRRMRPWWASWQPCGRRRTMSSSCKWRPACGGSSHRPNS